MENRIKQELQKIIDNGVYMITLEGKRYKNIYFSEEQAFKEYRELLKCFPRYRFDNYHEKGMESFIEFSVHKIEIEDDIVDNLLENSWCRNLKDVKTELSCNDAYYIGSEVVHQRYI